MTPDEKEIEESLVLASKTTRELMSPSELTKIQGAILKHGQGSAERGVALKLLQKANEGNILSAAEGIVIAKSVAGDADWYQKLNKASAHGSRHGIPLGASLVREEPKCGGVKCNYMMKNPLLPKKKVDGKEDCGCSK